jgi:hypothetical protein
LDLLEGVVTTLSQRFSFDMILTQSEDLGIVLSGLVRVICFFFVVPILILEVFMFSAPAFFTKEKIRLNFLLSVFLLGFVFSFVIFIVCVCFYLKYSTELLSSSLFFSVQFFVDFHKMFSPFFVFFHYILFIFFPLNWCFVIFFSSVSLHFSLIRLIIFSYAFFNLLGFFNIEDDGQFFLVSIVCFLILEFILLTAFIVLNLRRK